MAQFNNLYDVANTIQMVLADKTSVAQSNIVVNTPPANPPNTENIYISLLWVNEQATHKNDGYSRNPDGTQSPPPITMTVYYLITTYGTTAPNAVRQNQILGEVLRTFHTFARLQLPLTLTGNLAGQKTVGTGPLGLNLVPQSEEMMEKLFSLLQISHRPFALYEFTQIQLPSYAPIIGPSGVVVPGGPNVIGPLALPSPIINSVLPRCQIPGGRIRIDGTFSGSPNCVFIGPGNGYKVQIPTANLTILTPGQTFTAVLPAATIIDVDYLTVQTGATGSSLPSDPFPVQVVEATTPIIDAPNALSMSRSGDLTITGANLLNATFIAAWPDTGLRSPSDFKLIPVQPPAPDGSSVTAVAADVSAAGLRLQSYRFAVRVGTSVYTPYILLNVTP